VNAAAPVVSGGASPGAAVAAVAAAGAVAGSAAGSAAGGAWADAALAADLLALDPAGLGGARLRGRPGPARDAWLARLGAGLPQGAPVRRIPAHIGEERLLGGLDLAATLRAGRPVTQKGLLAECDGGVAVLAMAERAGATVAAHLGMALDVGAVTLARDGVEARVPARLAVVALDEGAEDGEAAPPALVERLAFDLDLDRLRPAPVAPRDLAAARARLPGVTLPAPLMEALCAATVALGVASPRAALFALRAARALAALEGRMEAGEADAALAARLTLGPRATQAPAPPEEETPEEETPEEETPDDAPDDETPDPDARPDAPPPQEPPQETPEDAADDDGPDLDALTEMMIAAARAALPAGLLEGLRAGPAARGGGAGTAGALRKAATRGRPIGARAGRPEGGARLDLVETLRAAAPWQPLRRRAAPERLGVLVRREDFRIRRFKRPAETVTIFAVDASGSAAAQRLAEAKGAVELLLAESYVRRDRVALVTFRGAAAELALPATRALARAKRALAGLPGGGGTPLAAGIDAALAEAEAALRHGWTPTLVLLTDARGNVARDGAGGRPRAMAEAMAAAARVRSLGVGALLIDASPRANPDAGALAAAMGARYLALPRADAAMLSGAVRAAQAAD